MKLGTYSTIDAPTENIDEARVFLVDEFSKIGGRVRQVSNSHELADYPSFEIDYPTELDDHDGDDCMICEVGEPCPLDIWHEQANKIENDYNHKFSQYL